MNQKYSHIKLLFFLALAFSLIGCNPTEEPDETKPISGVEIIEEE